MLLVSLELIHKVAVSSAVVSLAFAPDERFIFAGLDDGHLLVLGLEHMSALALETQRTLEQTF